MTYNQDTVLGINKKMIGTPVYHLLVVGLNQLYSAENYLITIVPHFIDTTTSVALRGEIMRHLDQTRFHVGRLSKAFNLLSETPEERDCPALKGICQEAEDLIQASKRGTILRDAAVIMGVRRIEYYEYSSYGSLSLFSELLEHTTITTLLTETLKEEQQAYVSLEKLADQSVNLQALKE